MKNILLICVLCFGLTGCGLLPKINFGGNPSTVPQSTSKGKAKEICKGQIEFHIDGTVKSCSEGYSSQKETYNKEERRMTIVERFKSFINNLVGWSFWIFLGLLIFAPGVLGFIFGRIIEGLFGISRKALGSTVKAVQKTRKEGKNLEEALSAEQDTEVKKFIRKLKEEDKIK